MQRFIPSRQTFAIAIALWGALAGVTGGAAFGQFDPFSPASAPPRAAIDVTDVRVLTDVKRIVPGGTFHLIVLFKAAPSWHLYWKNPGAGAAAPLVEVRAPSGFEVKPVRFPRPKIIDSPVGEMYCHEGEFALFVPITAAESHRSAVLLTADISWAVCDEDICLIGDETRTLSVEYAAPLAPDRDVKQPAAVRHAPRLPEPIEEAADAHAAFEDGVLRIEGPARGHESAVFIPNGSPGIDYGKPRITFEKGRFVAVVDVAVNPRDFTRREPRIGGLLGLGEKVTDPAYEVDLPLQPELQNP